MVWSRSGRMPVPVPGWLVLPIVVALPADRQDFQPPPTGRL